MPVYFGESAQNQQFLVPLFFQEVSIPMLGAIDAVSPCLILAAWQIYSLALIKDYKSQYPLGIIANNIQ